MTQRRPGRHRPALLLLAAAAACLALPAAAVQQSALGAYLHTRWTAADGAPAQITAMAQTTDGWLWLGTLDGLYRFDGLQFSRYPLPPRLGLNRNLVMALRAGPKGELYIGYAGEGLSVLHRDGRLEHLPAPSGGAMQVHTPVVDTDGSLWAISGGIQHYNGGRWHTVDAAPHWEAARRNSIALDRRGGLWATSDAGTWRLDRASGRFDRILASGGELLTAPDGRLWTIALDGTAWLADDGDGTRPPAPDHAQGHDRAQFGPDGALWLLHCPRHACVVDGAARRMEPRYDAPAAATRSLDDAAAQPGEDPRDVLVDREGNVWISSETGLSRYRRNSFAPAGLRGVGEDYSLATDAGGRVWAAHAVTGQLWQLRADGAPLAVAGTDARVVARDRHGALLVGGLRSIRRLGADGVETIPLPPGPGGAAADLNMLGILDDGKVLWTATLQTGLIGWRDGRWQPRAAFHLPPKIYQSATGAPGQLWLATGDGTLVAYDVERDSANTTDIRALGFASAIFPGDALALSGDAGFGFVRDGVLHMQPAGVADALRNATGAVTTPDGDRWFNGAAGLVHVRAQDWNRSAADPSEPLRFELFDATDGYPGRAARQRRWASAWSGDGRNLWLATSTGVVRFDTAAVERNSVAPTPVIAALATDAARYAPAGTVSLPPGTSQLRVEYTAPALRKPERIRFEYRLDGVDDAWRDGGTRRVASYANLGPGNYVFRVRAINEDGVAGTGDATVALRIEPTLLQRTWFRALGGALLVLLGVLVHRWRVRYLTARVTERMRVRTAERERIARTLHDTFLQTVQGLMLRLDGVAASLPPDAGARRQLEAVLADAGQAIGEGRDQLQELREGDDQVLEDRLRDIIARLQATYGVTILLRVDGERRALCSDVAHETADIAREALHNACAHGGRGTVRAHLVYGRRALALTVGDGGAGFPAAVLRDGMRAGHWGLVGMRERAERLDGRLVLFNDPKGGAVVALTVPALRAYAEQQSTSAG